MIKISNASLGETNEIKRLLNYVWIDTYKEFFSQETIKYITEESQTIDKLKLEIENKNLLFLVAKDNLGNIVGLATAEEKENKIFLQRLYVYPDCQRKGIGIKLLLSVLKHFKDKQAIYLEAEKNNIKGINFYKKNGFQIIENKKYKLKDDKFSTVVMEREM
jgi:ribosomal protein S18 acetylase RimI-like enzyme